MRKLATLLIGLALMIALQASALADAMPLRIPDGQANADSPYPSPSPVWLWNDCEIPSVTIAWYNPPEDVPPFEILFSGFLVVVQGNRVTTEVMAYIGVYDCPLYPGCVYYRWRKPYTKPEEGIYTLSAYVVNTKGDLFYTHPIIYYPGCNGTVDVQAYLPVILK